MLTWMLIGTCLVVVVAWKIIQGAEKDDQRRKVALRRAPIPDRYQG